MFCVLGSLFQKISPVQEVRTSGVEVSEINRRCNEYYRRAAGYTMLLVLPLLQRIYVNDQFFLLLKR